MTDVLYRWPEAAKFGRRVPKEKLYEHGAVNTVLREKFISELERITWAYKLAESTINLPATSAVPEVQVFTLEAKTNDISEAILTAIDRAVQFPIIFEITRSITARPEVRTVAAHKQLRAGAPKLSAYYSTAWQPEDAQRQPLPTAINLPALYAALLQPLMPTLPVQARKCQTSPTDWSQCASLNEKSQPWSASSDRNHSSTVKSSCAAHSRRNNANWNSRGNPWRDYA